MNKALTLFMLFLLTQSISGQINDTLNQNVGPIGGINSLAVKYYGIEFSKEQRARLKDKEIEFIFQVDELGNPTLEEVNGISDADIIDSLKAKTLTIGKFKPSIQDGIPRTSIYFMRLTYPSYQLTKQRYGFLQSSTYREATLKDFEYIHKSGQHFDFTIGGMANQFIGKPAKYLRFGGGMKIDMTFTAKNQYLYGLNMSIYGNKLKTAYPVNTLREQVSAPPTGLIGAIFGKWMGNINVQGELNLASHNLTKKIGDNDPDWIQLNGFSPGIMINYLFDLGKEQPTYYYGSPILFGNKLNLHFGLRYLKYSLREASGFMVELGVSYRMVLSGIKEYKLKDEFLAQ